MRRDPGLRSARALAATMRLAAVGGLIAPAAAQSPCGGGWAPVNLPGPAPREGQAMAFDALQGRTILFGGTNTSAQPPSDTWRYSGAGWSFVSTGTPVGRHGAAMAYDAHFGRAFLFGGYSGRAAAPGGYEGDTWELGPTWTLRDAGGGSGPSPRAGHAMAFMGAGPGGATPRNRTLLFGGSFRPGIPVPVTRYGDTWEWSSQGFWSLVATDGPAPRDFAAMAFDPVRQKAVLFGGLTNTPGADAETWEWDAGAGGWSLVPLPGPAGRYGASMAFDAERSVTVLFGGVPGQTETWQYAGPEGGQDGAWSLLLSPAFPSQRVGEAMVYDTLRRRLVLFGGRAAGFTYLGDTWEASFADWPVVYRGPASAGLSTGCAATFDVLAATSPLNRPVSYQWRRDGVDLADDARITGATTFQLTIAAAEPGDAGQYDVVVTSACGSARTLPATLLVGDPEIVAGPAPARSCPSGPALFEVVAVGVGSLAYRWQVRVGPDDWADLAADPLTLPCGAAATADPPGAPSTTITITPCAGAPAGAPPSFELRAVVADAGACGAELFSQPAPYTVCAADYTCLNGVDLLDIFAFLNAWFAGRPAADFNHQNGVDLLDIFAFLRAWFAGCP